MMPEILAPAGSMETLCAALRCGADAVYVGAKEYSARSSAVNFSLEELKEAVRLCHLYHAKLHLAVNTLLTDTELKQFEQFIRDAADCGIDACIVQDLGVLELIRALLPEMPLHASTQMSIHTPAGAMLAKELGCCRVVAAREMSRDDLKALCRLPVETEVFVHGALCMSVSGQCSFSSVVGGRSANRGQCAQACRLPWHTPKGSNPAALSLKDLSLVSHVRELADMGVDSFKIEGRMKRPEYVAAAVTALRMALNGQTPDMDVLQSVFSRSGFTDGYFTGKKQNMFGTRTKKDVLAGQNVLKQIQSDYAKPRSVTELNFDLKFRSGQPAVLNVSDNDGNEIQITGDIPQPALKTPLGTETLRKHFQKLGNTIYTCGSVMLDNPDHLILSAAQCNTLRRNAADVMNEQRIQVNTPIYQKAFVPEIPKQEIAGHAKKRLHVRTPAQMQKALELPDCILCLPMVLAEQCHASESIYVESPRIIANEAKYAQRLSDLYQKGYRHLLCHNAADIRLGKEIGYLLHGGFGLNCTNIRAAYALKKQGLQDITASYELYFRNLPALESVMPCGIYFYGRLPMMLLRVCPIKAQDGCHHKNCFLTDRTGRRFPLLCSQHYMELFNSEILFLSSDDFRNLSYHDFYFTDEKPEQINRICTLRTAPERRTSGLYFKGGLK